MKFFQCMILAVAVSVLTGCAGDQEQQRKLVEGKTALEQHQYERAINAADAVLQQNPSNVDAAAAHYLRGRAVEQRPKEAGAVAQDDMSIARTEYNRALALAPSKTLEGYIRDSLANDDFYQDDYEGAFEQWSKAYDLLQDKSLRAWALYRIGLCQQRLGRFGQADKTFLQVQEVFPQTEQSKLAHERAGAQSFHVQLATFNSSKSADAAIAELNRQGVTATKSTDIRGLTTVRVGPCATYAEAMQIKQRFAARYADALILP